jgi:hypothetical protein
MSVGRSPHTGAVWIDPIRLPHVPYQKVISRNLIKCNIGVQASFLIVIEFHYVPHRFDATFCLLEAQVEHYRVCEGTRHSHIRKLYLEHVPVRCAFSGIREKYRVFQKEFYNFIPNITVWWVLRKRLHLKAYKISIVFVTLATHHIWNTIVKLFLTHPALPLEVILNRNYPR